MTPVDAATLVATLEAAYPSQAPISDQLSRLIAGELVGMDRNVGAKAVRRHIRSCRFFPSIAELVVGAAEIAGEINAGIALEQWGAVCRAIDSVGVYRPSPKFGDRVTDQCVRSMGWRYLCKSPSGTSDRARFCELYNAIQNREMRLAATGDRTLAGLAMAQLEGGNEDQ